LIDQEIEKCVAEIRKLKSRRNTLAPISRLPPEILSNIFMLCVTDNDGHFTVTPYRWSWITISHICRHWRNVALECSSLWCHLDFSKPDWIPEMLNRSKVAPLSVKIRNEHYFSKKSLDALNAAFQHMYRIKELDLCVPAGDFEDMLCDITQAAPCIHTLSVSSKPSSLFTLARTISLPQDFLSGDAPSLTHLELRDVHLPWGSSLLKNLTCLKIFHSGTTFRPSLEQLVEILSCMPSLGTLELQNVLPTTRSLLSTEVVLSHLCDIRLEGDIAACAILLDRISFPSTTKMHFVCKMTLERNQTPVQRATPILPSLSRICGRLSKGSTPFESEVIYMLSITLGGGVDMTIGLSAAGDLMPAWMKISMRFYHHVQEQNAELAAKVCEAIEPQLSQVRLLSVNAERGLFYSKNLSQVLFSFAQLQVFELQGSCADDALRELVLLERDQNRAAAFPSLTLLSLADVDFDEDRTEESELLDELMDVLMLRYEAQAEIQSLHLKSCTRLSEYDVNLLREICTDVTWDGIETGFDSENDVDSEPIYSGIYYEDSDEDEYDFRGRYGYW